MIEVKYNGLLVGHTDNGITISFLDNSEAKYITNKLKTGTAIYVSSRSIGIINSDNTVTKNEPFEFDIYTHPKK